MKCRTIGHISHRLDGWTVRRPGLTIGLSAVFATMMALVLPWWMAVSLAALAAASCLVGRSRLWRLVALSLALFLLAATAFRGWRVASLSALNERVDTISGQVVALPKSGRMVTVEVTRAELVPSGTQVGVFFPDELAPELWETVTARVKLNAVPMSGYQPGRGVFLSAFPVDYDDGHVQVTADGSAPLGALINTYWYSCLRRALPDESGGVLAALCLGREEGLSPMVEEAFRQSGLSHLLVVSGLHLSLVVLAVQGLLRRLGLGCRLSAALTIPAMGLFVLVVGVSPSVLRAGTMCLCWLVGRMLRRRADGLNSLGLAVAVLLLMNPYQIYHAGFQLSFLATAGMLCLPPVLCGWLYRRVPAETRWGRWGQRAFSFVYSAAAVCVSGMLFTLPVQCYYFGGFSAAAPLSNLLAVVSAGWVLLVGWLGLLFSAVPLLGWVGRALLWLAGIGAEYLVKVANACRFSWAQIAVTTLWGWLLVTLLCGLIIYALLRRLSWRRWVPPVLTLTVLVLAAGRLLTVPALRLTVQPVSGGTAVLVEQGERAALLLTHSAGLGDAARLLDEADCDGLDWVLIQEGEAANAGALTALCFLAEQPRVGVLGETDWYTGASCSVTGLNYRTPLTLWEGCTLTSTTKTWWRLQIGEQLLMLGGDARIPCPIDEGLAVYTGIPESVRAPAVMVCTVKEAEKLPPEYAGNPLVLTEESMTFTVREDGEWSVLPWQ